MMKVIWIDGYEVEAETAEQVMRSLKIAGLLPEPDMQAYLEKLQARVLSLLGEKIDISSPEAALQSLERIGLVMIKD